jgi:hypothetical protein
MVDIIAGEVTLGFKTGQGPGESGERMTDGPTRILRSTSGDMCRSFASVGVIDKRSFKAATILDSPRIGATCRGSDLRDEPGEHVFIALVNCSLIGFMSV